MFAAKPSGNRSFSANFPLCAGSIPAASNRSFFFFFLFWLFLAVRKMKLASIFRALLYEVEQLRLLLPPRVTIDTKSRGVSTRQVEDNSKDE